MQVGSLSISSIEAAAHARVPIRVVSERLGHSTPGFTNGHIPTRHPGMQHDAALTFAQLLHEAARTNLPAVSAGSTDFYPVEVPAEGEPPPPF